MYDLLECLLRIEDFKFSDDFFPSASNVIDNGSGIDGSLIHLGCSAHDVSDKRIEVVINYIVDLFSGGFNQGQWVSQQNLASLS